MAAVHLLFAERNTLLKWYWKYENIKYNGSGRESLKHCHHHIEQLPAFATNSKTAELLKMFTREDPAEHEQLQIRHPVLQHFV